MLKGWLRKDVERAAKRVDEWAGKRDSIDLIMSDLRLGRITKEQAAERLKRYRDTEHSWIERLVGG